MLRRSFVLLVLLALTIGIAAPVGASERRVVSGIYRLMAKDTIDARGNLRDVYQDLLVTQDRTYRLRLPRGARRPAGGTPVKVTGTLSGQDMQAEQVEATATPEGVATTGATDVLVMLVYWTAPDSVTQSQAKAQVFTDDNGYFAEASYGQLGLRGTATPWMKITGPTGGLCYSNHMQIMERAKNAATSKGYNVSAYDRYIAYFPMCSGGDSAGAAGWAYQPGNEVWLNGYFDRRVSVHEQGHNYGLYHAHTLDCSVSGKRVTLTSMSNCSRVEYGDNWDAMGASIYAAHFSASMKNTLGWLGGRKRSLSSGETTFTLPPFEVSSSTPITAVASTSVSTRKYWIEYRRKRGYDAALPDGATDGVLVHMRDTAVTPGPMLLDASPQNGWDDTVIPPGGSWTSPERVRITVNSISPSGVSVTVDGAADPATAPSAPRSFTATAGDESARLTWTAPSSNGGATIESYVITSTPSTGTTTVDGSVRAATIGSLTNGTTYTFSIKAKNSAGSSLPATATVTPTILPPSVTLTAPTAGSEVYRTVTMTASATPNPTSAQPIEYVEFSVDGNWVAADYVAPYSGEWDSSWAADGPHTITATAYDAGGRFDSSSVAITTEQPRPTVSITAPTNGSVITEDLVSLRASATPAVGSDATIEYVEYKVGGQSVAWGYAPDFEATWDTTTLNGSYTLVATAYDSAYDSADSTPVSVTVNHPVAAVSITAPTAGSTVRGNAVPVSATVTPVAGTTISWVEFFVDGGTSIGFDSEAPYAVEWNSAGLSGTHEVTAAATDSANHTGVSAPVSVTVDNPLPSVSITAPEERQALDPGMVTFTAAPEPNPDSLAAITRVDFEVDGSVVGTVNAPGPYSTQWDGTYAYDLHTLVAIAYDADGQYARSSPTTFTIIQPAPVVSITSPSDGGLLRTGTRTIQVSATPDPGTSSPVQWVELYVDGVYAGYEPVDGSGMASFEWAASRGDFVIAAVATDADWLTGSAEPIAVTVADLAAAPTGVSAVRASSPGQAIVSWTDPEDDGGSAITGYDVVANDGTSNTVQEATGSPYTFTGLTNGRKYTFKVRAVTAVGNGALSAATSPVTPGTPTTLSISVSSTTVTYPNAVTVRGTLLGPGSIPVAGKTVKLLRCAPGTTTCSAVKSATTGSDGRVSVSYVLNRHRDLRLKFYGADPYLAKTSSAKYVRVRVSVSSAISRTSMPLGRSATVSGTVKPAHAGKYVYLQRYYDGAWRNVTKKLTNSYSKVSFTVKPSRTGTYKYRLKFLEDREHLAGVSTSRSVKVY